MLPALPDGGRTIQPSARRMTRLRGGSRLAGMSHLSNVWFKVTDLEVTHGSG
jgi:hypothetical protein